jgi:hypothetical protein
MAFVSVLRLTVRVARQSMDRDPYEIKKSSRLTFYMANLSIENLPTEVGRLKLHLTMSWIRYCSYHGPQAYQHRITVDPKCRHLR